MTQAVEFYFDVGSPAAYIAWTQLPAIARAAGSEIAYRPILLGGVFHATGNRSPTEVASKGQYMLDDLQRFAGRYGVPFRHNPHFPINTLTLMRIVLGLQLREPQRMVPCADAMFRALWVDGLDLGDPGTLDEVLRQAGFDTERVLALAGDAGVKEALKEATREAVARGVFGAPTFFVGAQMFWGQDRLDFVKEALQP